MCVPCIWLLKQIVSVCKNKFQFLFFSPFQKLPDAEFHVVPDAGHSNKEPGVQTLLVEACDKYKNLWYLYLIYSGTPSNWTPCKLVTWGMFHQKS